MSNIIKVSGSSVQNALENQSVYATREDAMSNSNSVNSISPEYWGDDNRNLELDLDTGLVWEIQENGDKVGMGFFDEAGINSLINGSDDTSNATNLPSSSLADAHDSITGNMDQVSNSSNNSTAKASNSGVMDMYEYQKRSGMLKDSSASTSKDSQTTSGSDKPVGIKKVQPSMKASNSGVMDMYEYQKRSGMLKDSSASTSKDSQTTSGMEKPVGKNTQDDSSASTMKASNSGVMDMYEYQKRSGMLRNNSQTTQLSETSTADAARENNNGFSRIRSNNDPTGTSEDESQAGSVSTPTTNNDVTVSGNETVPSEFIVGIPSEIVQNPQEEVVQNPQEEVVQNPQEDEQVTTDPIQKNLDEGKFRNDFSNSDNNYYGYSEFDEMISQVNRSGGISNLTPQQRQFITDTYGIPEDQINNMSDSTFYDLTSRITTQDNDAAIALLSKSINNGMDVISDNHINQLSNYYNIPEQDFRNLDTSALTQLLNEEKEKRKIRSSQINLICSLHNNRLG